MQTETCQASKAYLMLEVKSTIELIVMLILVQARSSKQLKESSSGRIDASAVALRHKLKE